MNKTLQLTDKFGRRHDYLRISVTDRCNLRCIYCMGPDGVPLLDHQDLLRYEDILEVAEAAAQLGFKKIRLSGGEPLIRRGLENLVKMIAGIPGIEDISMTTNGQLLEQKAMILKEAGLKRVNISLDSLNPDTYRSITRGGELDKVLRGIEAACRLGLSPVKLNVVLMKDVNDNEIPNFFLFLRDYPVHLRFIEYMPMGCESGNWQGRYCSLEKVKEVAAQLGTPLSPADEMQDCRGPAELYHLPGVQGLIGLIHPISESFCERCNRLRLTADGFLKPCLYWDEEVSVKPALGDPEAMKLILQRALDFKKEGHAMQSQHSEVYERSRSMSKIGG